MLVEMLVEVVMMVVVPKVKPKRLAEKPSGREKPDWTSRPTVGALSASAVPACLPLVDLSK